jgi:hypothetical protein
MQPEPERIYRAFSAGGEMRSLTKAGYVRFRDYLLYGEQNPAGERVLVNMFQDVLTLEYEEQPLSRYSVERQPDEKLCYDFCSCFRTPYADRSHGGQRFLPGNLLLHCRLVVFISGKLPSGNNLCKKLGHRMLTCTPCLSLVCASTASLL